MISHITENRCVYGRKEPLKHHLLHKYPKACPANLARNPLLLRCSALFAMQLIEERGGNSTHRTYCFTLVVDDEGCSHKCCQADLNKIEVCPGFDPRVLCSLTPAWGVC